MKVKQHHTPVEAGRNPKCFRLWVEAKGRFDRGFYGVETLGLILFQMTRLHPDRERG